MSGGLSSGPLCDPPCDPACWLLIGNSRWHWFQTSALGPRTWSEPPELAAGSMLRPRRWAAVGPLPEPWPAVLDPADRLALDQVPLGSLPPWLGIDRALAGYEAWCRCAAPVLVADAGTALSLTWVDGAGHFRGGRLMAGALLQLQALHRGTAALPAVPWQQLAPEPWPLQTDAAMASGVLEGLAGALQRAAEQLLTQEPDLQLWLTGGDAEGLLPLLQQPIGARPQPWRLAPGLCLDGLVRVDGLRPAPGP